MTEKLNEPAPFEADPNQPVETGLIAAPKAPDIPLPVTVPVTAAPPAPPQLPDGWDVPKALELIDALARKLYDEAYILKQYNLSANEFKALSANPWFSAAVETAAKDWHAATNVNTRLAIEAALALEKNLPALAHRMGSKTESLQYVTALAKLFAEIAGSVGTARPQHEQRSEKFKIVFNLGADMQEFDKTRPLVQINDEGGNSLALQQLLEGPGAPAPLQANSKGSGN